MSQSLIFSLCSTLTYFNVYKHIFPNLAQAHVYCSRVLIIPRILSIGPARSSVEVDHLSLFVLHVT
jgi:hypothetical protein